MEALHVLLCRNFQTKLQGRKEMSDDAKSFRFLHVGDDVSWVRWRLIEPAFAHKAGSTCKDGPCGWPLAFSDQL